MSKKRDNQALNTIDIKGCLDFPFNFLGDTILEHTTRGTKIKKLAADNGIKFCSVAPTKKLFKACDENFKYQKLGLNHPVCQFFETKVWDSNGKCNDENLLLCAVDKINLADACPWSKSIAGSIGDLCECAT